MNIGIVGLPNVGKSTLFNALTKAGAQSANYPFCTIEPNVGVVPVPDPRLDEISKLINPEKIIPTSIEFVDIAGLVAGASKGEGLGNQFLGNIRNTDAIAHVVRCFENEDIIHVAGKINPLHDIEIINTELTLADLDTVEKALSKVSKAAKTGNKEELARKMILERFKEHLNEAKPLRLLTMTEPEKQVLESLHLLTDKPTLYIANVAEDGFVNNPYLEEVKQIAHNEGAAIVAICASIEADMADLPDAEKQAFLADLGFKEPGLNRVIRAAYHLLHLVTFFTAGPKEVRAWTISRGATAPQAAGKIHSDFEKGFIRAEVIGYADFIEYGGEHGAKEAGRLRVEGREYIVHDGDLMHFRFNV